MKQSHSTPFIIPLLLMVLATVGPIHAAAFPHPPTALLILTRSGSTDQYSPAMEISKVEFESAMALKVLQPDGQSTTVPKNQIGLVFHYPDTLTILADASDADALSAKRVEATALISRFPRSKPFLDRVVAQIDSDLQKLASGQARLRGMWQTPRSRSGPDADRWLTIKGVTYLDPEITRLDNGTVVLKHREGVTRIPLMEATPELLLMLRAQPEWFGATVPVQELEVSGIKYTRVILLGMDGESVTLLHEQGMVVLAMSQLSGPQMQALTSSNPSLVATITAKASLESKEAAKPEAPVVSGQLPRTAGTGVRNSIEGWLCTPEESRQWRLAAKEAFIRPSLLGFYKDLNSGRIKPSAEMPQPLPSYGEALAFINSKIDPLVVGYSQVNQCLVLREKVEGAEEVRAAFDPKDLNADLRLHSTTEFASITLEGRNGGKVIMAYGLWNPDQNGNRKLWRDLLSELHIAVGTPDDARRVARAFSWVLIMLGARHNGF